MIDSDSLARASLSVRLSPGPGHCRAGDAAAAGGHESL